MQKANFCVNIWIYISKTNLFMKIFDIFSCELINNDIINTFVLIDTFVTAFTLSLGHLSTIFLGNMLLQKWITFITSKEFWKYSRTLRTHKSKRYVIYVEVWINNFVVKNAGNHELRTLSEKYFAIDFYCANKQSQSTMKCEALCIY